MEVIRQHRQTSAISFLGEALYDVEMSVWKQAIDGLVALASPMALKALHAAKAREFPSPKQTDEFRHWLDEAIEQVEQDLAENRIQ